MAEEQIEHVQSVEEEVVGVSEESLVQPAVHKRESEDDDGKINKKAKTDKVWREEKNLRVVDEAGNPLVEERRPKKKVACLVGYCGTGYHGMQFNPPSKTIEGDLFDAFVKLGAISKNNSNDLKKSGFQRAARTDKGVHAAGNVISLKLIIEDPDIVAKINAELPDQIKVWGIERTNKGFDCRRMCSSRIYEYLIPTFSFLPPKKSSPLGKLIEEAREKFPGVSRDDVEGNQWWQSVTDKLHENEISDEDIETALIGLIEHQQGKVDVGGETELSKLIKRIKKIENECRRLYRISDERVKLIQDLLNLYVGHHNFHNFTLGKNFKDPSANRYMKSLTISKPFVIEGTEWCSIKIHGQSFMLHQIRKMIAMVSLVVRTGCPLERITELFNSEKINIPKLPALGLLLEQPVYESYNSRLDSLGYNHITFDPYEKEMLEFKMKNIYDKIYKEEIQENVFHGFFNFIDGFNNGEVFSFLTARGIEKIENDGKEIEVPKEETAEAIV